MKPKKTGMVVAPCKRQYIARGALQNFLRRAAFLGRRLHELFFEFLLEIPVPGALCGEVLDSLHEEFRRPARQIEHLLGRHPKAVAFEIRRFASFRTCHYVSSFDSIQPETGAKPGAGEVRPPGWLSRAVKPDLQQTKNYQPCSANYVRLTPQSQYTRRSRLLSRGHPCEEPPLLRAVCKPFRIGAVDKIPKSDFGCVHAFEVHSPVGNIRRIAKSRLSTSPPWQCMLYQRSEPRRATP